MSEQKSDKLTIWDLYKEENFIDAKDNQGDWRVGYIVAKLDFSKTFRVRFDGWSSKYDQTYKHNSYKLQPFRSIVTGYTGQVQNPGVRQDWKFVPARHQQRLGAFTEFMTSPEKGSVHELNQLLRGHNYMYTDYLMTYKFNTPEHISYAIEYFEANVKFLGQYLKTISQQFATYLAVISTHKDIEHWNTIEALYRAYYEVFDTNYTIWGSYPRLNGFFRDNGDLIKLYFNEETSKIQPKKMMQAQMTQLLLKVEGYHIIGVIVDQLLQNQEFVPFLFLHSFTSLLTALYTLISHKEKEILIEKMIKIGDRNLNQLKDVHLKELHKHHVNNFLAALVTFSSKTKFQQSMLDWTTERELQLALKLMVCPFFQKKLKGIAYMIEVLKKHDFILKNGFFKSWSERNNLYEILFLNSDNHEFIRKGCELAKYLYIKNNLIEQNIDLIIKSRTGKHQTVLKQIYNLICDFALYEASQEQKLQLFHKVATVPEDQWDQDYIHMIRELSQNSYGLNLRQKLIHSFGFQMVYKYVVKVESDFALGELIHILNRIQKSYIYNQFQENCFLKIQKQQKAWIHIKILLMMCNNRIDTFDQLEINLVKILIKTVVDHASRENSKVPQDGLQLLTQITKHTTREIQVDDIGILWKNLIVSPYREHFMRWLYRKKDNGRVVLNQSLNQASRKYLLTELWNSPQQIKTMTPAEAVFLGELFKTVNCLFHKLNRINVIIRPISFELEAYEKLWEVLRETQDQKVVTLMCDLLAQLHTCYEGDQLTQSIQNLVQTLAQNIRVAMEKQNTDYLTRMLKLTQKLILRDEQVFPPGPQPRISYIRQYTVLNRYTNETKIFKYNCMHAFYDFKKLLSDKFNIPLYQLVVYNSRGDQIKLESYFKSLNELMMSSPKFEILENPEYQSVVKTSLNGKLDLFFQLLDDQRIEKQVWRIVEKLPISNELKFKLVETEDIMTELNSVGFYKELYELKVVLELPEQWWVNFVTSQRLTELVKNFNKVNFKTHIQLQYIATLSDIIQKMLTINAKDSKDLQIDQKLSIDIIQIIKTLLQVIEKDKSKSLDLQIKIIKNIFSILESLRSVTNTQVCRQLLQQKQYQLIFELGLIKIPNLGIRKVMYEQLKIMFKGIQDDKTIQGYLSLLLGRILSLIVSLPHTKTVKQYFLFTSFFLSQLTKEQIGSFKQSEENRQLCLKFFKLLSGQPGELSPDSPNTHLIGYLSLMKYLIASQDSSLQSEITQFVLHKCLFTVDKQSVCKSQAAREQSFDLLGTIMFNNPKILQSTCQEIMSMHKVGQWRTKRLDDWTITLLDKMKSTSGFVGIKNLGCICYMSSFMQQLFGIPRFRNAITTCEETAFVPELKEENLLYQVQKMFLNLWMSDKKFYNPAQFCYAFKDYQGNPTNVTQQMDIDQFSNVLFDRLQNQMRDSNRPTLIKDMFGGVFSNQIVCKGCPHYSETQENFLSISLTVKSKKNIYQSFDTMIKGDNLDGDNAYYCERCNKKVSAVKRVSLKKLPDYLIVTLKRFEFDYQKMMKLKVNDYCEFPQHLKLSQYSRQFLRKQESTKPQQLEQQQVYSDDYFNYVLKGIVVHLGYADSGHYYSFIQSRQNGKWHEYNDTIVRDFNIDDMPDQCFGGQTSGYQGKEKIKNAYLLIYQRQNKISKQTESSISKRDVIELPQNKPILEGIYTDNREQKMQNIIFSQEYGHFVEDLLSNISKYSPQNQKLVMKYVITVYLTKTVREKSEGLVYGLLKKIHAKMDLHQQLKEWVVSLFSQRKIFQQFFKNCMIREVKKTLAHWLVELYSQCNRQCQHYFLNNILTRMTQDNQNVLEHSLMLYLISKKDQKSLDYLVQKGLVGRYIENMVRKDPSVFVQKLQLLPEVESQIGNEIVAEKPESQSIKKLKIDNQNGYVWALINLIVQKTKKLKVPLQSYLTQTEVGYLRLSDVKYYKILQELKTKFQINQFINYLCQLSIDNKELVLALNKHIMQGLKDFQSKRYRQFFILFQKMINVQDDLRKLRLQGFRSLLEGLIANQKYSLDSNIIMQWILILVNRNQHLKASIQVDQTTCNYLMKAATKKIPSDEVAKKNNTYGQFMINKLHGVKFPRSKKAYVKLTEAMAAFYKNLLDESFEESQIWPSAPETEVADLKTGNVVAYFDAKEKLDYEEGRVESIFLGRLEVLLKKGRTLHVWNDDEKLSLDIKLLNGQEIDDLNSSRTTEMDIDDEDDYYDDL